MLSIYLLISEKSLAFILMINENGADILDVNLIRSTKNPPKELTNSIGKVVLRTSDGFVKGQGGLNEPLASNFSIFDGSVNITVPKVPARGDYQVICKLFYQL